MVVPGTGCLEKASGGAAAGMNAKGSVPQDDVLDLFRGVNQLWWNDSGSYAWLVDGAVVMPGAGGALLIVS